MIIGDVGSDEDVTSGYAITGYQESILSKFAKENGLDWNSFYRTLLIKERGKLIEPKVNFPLLTDDY